MRRPRCYKLPLGFQPPYCLMLIYQAQACICCYIMRFILR